MTVVGSIDFSERLSGHQKGLLTDVLTDLYPTAGALNAFLIRHDMRGVAMYGGDRPLDEIALDVVQEAWRKGLLGSLTIAVRRQFPTSPTLRNLDQKLLSLAEPKVLLAPPPALSFDRTDPLEWAIREGSRGSPLNLATAIVNASGRTGRIQYRKGSKTTYGTGFLVGSDLLLTAHHVVRPLIDGDVGVNKAVVTFGYVETDEGPQQPENVGLAAAEWILDWRPCSKADLRSGTGDPLPDELDYALLRLASPVGTTRGWYDLDDSVAPPDKTCPVFIIQHPEGEPQQYSIGWTLHENEAPHRLRYNADTLGGSSGGLVLDDRMQPVALHHAGDPLEEEMDHEYNQGIPLIEISASIIRKRN